MWATKLATIYAYDALQAPIQRQELGLDRPFKIKPAQAVFIQKK